MELIIQIQIATLCAVVFGAGILYNKVNNLEKRSKLYEDNRERIVKIETILKKQIANEN